MSKNTQCPWCASRKAETRQNKDGRYGVHCLDCGATGPLREDEHEAEYSWASRLLYTDDSPSVEAETRLKRSNWMNDEVIDILKGCKLVPRRKKDDADDADGIDEYVANANAGLEAAIDIFYDMSRPLEYMGALAYEVDTGDIVHVGTIPPEAVIQLKDLETATPDPKPLAMLGCAECHNNAYISKHEDREGTKHQCTLYTAHCSYCSNQVAPQLSESDAAREWNRYNAMRAIQRLRENKKHPKIV